MIHHAVKQGTVGCNKSCKDGLYLVSVGDEDGKVRAVLTEDQLRAFINRLQAMLPVEPPSRLVTGCPKCGGSTKWRQGVGFEHERICNKCYHVFEP